MACAKMEYGRTYYDTVLEAGYWMLASGAPPQEETKKHVEKNKKGPVELALIGCKCDLAAEKRQVTRLEAEKLAGEKGLPYFEASAKTNQNVAEAFEDLAARVLRRKGPASSDAVLLSEEPPARRSRCCN